jgi:hypothetical protein
MAVQAWTVGHLALTEEEGDELPAAGEIAAHRKAQLGEGTVEAVLLDRRAQGHSSFRLVNS